VGAAMTVCVPSVDIMFGDFSTLIMDQMVNQAAKGPLHVRREMESSDGDARHDGANAPLGGTALAVAPCLVWTHSGLKVVIPSTP
jgi:pyruvate dehydrogenase E1 component beta subunit